MTTKFEFEFVAEPPARSRGRNALYADFRAALRERAGEWAKWPNPPKDAASARAVAGNVNRNSTGTWDGFEARSSGVDVYVCFVGGAE